jgi:uncharacterized LabA/DUF88 family protein
MGPEDKIGQLKEAIKSEFSIYIDAANLEQSVKEMHVIPSDVPEELRAHKTSELKWSVDYDKFKKFFTVYGQLGDIHFYTAQFVTDNHKKFLTFLKKGLGFQLNTKPLKEYRDHTPEKPHRKANFDVEISVDAVVARDSYKTVVLFSGDCDFEYLIRYLRGQGKIVIVFSMKGHVAEELPPASSYYFDVIDFRHSLLKVIPKRKP